METEKQLEEKVDALLNLMNEHVYMHVSDQRKCEVAIGAIRGSAVKDVSSKMHIMRTWSNKRRALTGLLKIITALETMQQQTRMRNIHIDLKEVTKLYCVTHKQAQADVIEADTVVESAAVVAMQLEQLKDIMSTSIQADDDTNTDEQLLEEFLEANPVEEKTSDISNTQFSYVYEQVRKKPDSRNRRVSFENG